MKSAKELLNINEKETAERIEKHIQNIVAENRVNGILMGLSGGLDSTVLVTLAVRALGKDRVCVYFLQDRNGEKDSVNKAQIVAEGLGLKLNVGSIDAIMREKEKDAAFFKFISKLPPFVLPFMSSLYYIIVGETPYMTTLRKEELKKSKFRIWLYDNIVNGLEEMFDGPCAARRVVLEKIAKEKNLLLIGSGNLSEDLTGWFTVNGVDNMPHSPIMRLLKTQVWQLAQYLNIPIAIQKRAPSADVLRGADDTLALGMSFGKIDIVLYGIEHNMSDDEIMEYGLTKNQIARVRKIYKMSAWKRSGRK
ncbi:MAG: NAD(+) synthase [Candidatus Omnitrophota bacterium]|jgi:NAD+ synthase|nr:NAD(+) synthase [Candidatus Omnitrophota bacterium]